MAARGVHPRPVDRGRGVGVGAWHRTPRGRPRGVGGRAVVALPQTDDHELLRRGRALRAHSVAEAVEATCFLLGNPPLAQTLGARGRLVASRLPSPGQVTLRMLEGVELARQSAAAVAR